MRKIAWFLLLLLVVGSLLLVGSCSGGSTGEDSPGPTISYSDINIPIGAFPDQPHMDVVMSTVVGEELTVTLGSNPTTGFQWQENATIGDEGIVEQTDHRFVASDSNAPGSPGQDVWTFKALKKGTTIISMECSRPWEERSLDNWTITITANVK